MIFSSFSTFITVSGGASKEADDCGAVGPVLVPESGGASAEKTAQNGKRWSPCPNSKLPETYHLDEDAKYMSLWLAKLSILQQQS
jgi:hypothetical protein